MAKFWAKMKSITFFMLKYCDYSLGNFWKNLDNFLIQNSAWQRQWTKSVTLQNEKYLLTNWKWPDTIIQTTVV